MYSIPSITLHTFSYTRVHTCILQLARGAGEGRHWVRQQPKDSCPQCTNALAYSKLPSAYASIRQHTSATCFQCALALHFFFSVTIHRREHIMRPSLSIAIIYSIIGQASPKRKGGRQRFHPVFDALKWNSRGETFTFLKQQKSELEGEKTVSYILCYSTPERGRWENLKRINLLRTKSPLLRRAWLEARLTDDPNV